MGDDKGQAEGYDTTEAIGLLSKLTQRAPPTNDAANALLEALSKVAEQAELHVDCKPSLWTFAWTEREARYPKQGASFTISSGMVCEPSGSAGPPHVPGIDYDFATDQIVGTEPDEQIAPIPGQRLSRRNPVTVLAELIVQRLTEQKAKAPPT